MAANVTDGYSRLRKLWSGRVGDAKADESQNFYGRERERARGADQRLARPLGFSGHHKNGNSGYSRS